MATTTPRRVDATHAPHIIRPKDGKVVDLHAHAVRFLIWGEESGGGFALVEYLVPPRTLAAPLHRHAREDEYSYLLEGQMQVQLGDNVVSAEAGTLVFKPRNQWHTFWNAGDEPGRVLEIIAPSGFEHSFDAVATVMVATAAADMAAEREAWSALNARYGLEVDLESVPRLREAHGLV